MKHNLAVEMLNRKLGGIHLGLAHASEDHVRLTAELAATRANLEELIENESLIVASIKALGGIPVKKETTNG